MSKKKLVVPTTSKTRGKRARFLPVLAASLMAISLHGVELVNEQFASDINGWTVSNSSKVYWSSSYSGSMFLDRRDWAYKTYNFGASYGSQTLDVQVRWCATTQWESSNDYLRVRVNDQVVENDYNDGGCQTTTFTADADADGDFKIEFSPRTSSNNEDAYIAWFTVNGTPVNSGCDNSLDTSANDASPGVAIPGLHGATGNVTTCISGSSASNDRDYYHFTVATEGQLDIITSSPNGHDNHFEVVSSTRGTLYPYDTGQNRSLSYTLAAGEQITLLMKETGSDTDWWQIDLTFTAAAQVPPIMNPIPNQTTSQGTAYTLGLSAYTQLTNGDPILQYHLVGTLPAGLSFNTATGVISGTATASGTFNLTASAEDDDGVSNTQSFTLTVTGETPPIMNPIPNQTATLNLSFTLDISAYVTLTNGDPIIPGGYSLSGTLPAGLSFDANTGILSGTPTASGGPYTLTASAEDNDGVSNVVSFTLTVSAVLICTDHDNGNNDDEAHANIITALDGIDHNTTACITGDSQNNDSDYYKFTVGADGVLKIDGSSPNGHAYYLKVYSDVGEYYPTTASDSHDVPGFALRSGTTVYVRVKETGSDRDEYRIDFRFEVGGTMLIPGDRPFTVRNPEPTRNVLGNYAIAGNSNLCAYDGSNAKPWSGTCVNSTSNSRPSRFIDTDADASTVNSTSSTINIPDDAEVIWAGLYWQGVVHNKDLDEDFMNYQTISGEPKFSSGRQIDFSQSSSTYGAEKVKFKRPGDGAYTEITAQQFDFYELGYAGFKEVTDLIDKENPNGIYTVADIKAHQGTESNHGNYGSWSLIIIYKDPDEKFRNITLFDGFVTVNSSYSGELVMDGFLTPKNPPIESKLALYAMDGDNGTNSLTIVSQGGKITNVQNQDNPGHSLFDSTISNNITRDANGTSLRTDLKVLDLIDVLGTSETRATLRPRSGGDRYTASFFIMSAELRVPQLCYDYAYMQRDHYFTEDNDGTKSPRIVGEDLLANFPINVEFYIQNKENSDVQLSNMKAHIVDINSSQVGYVRNSTSVIPPGTIYATDIVDTDYSDSYNRNIPIGNGIIDSKDFFYLYYDLDVRRSSVDMPLTIMLEYDTTYDLGADGNVTLHTVTSSHELPLCSSDNFKYTPAYGIFNIEDSVLTHSNKYNLPTQTASRPGDFVVAAYESSDIYVRKNVITIAAVEMIDAGAFHGIDTTCSNPESKITPRVWVVFENNTTRTDFTKVVIDTAIASGMVSDQLLHEETPISTAEEYYQNAGINTAFRISYNGAGGGDLVQLIPVECHGGGGTCFNVGNFTEIIKYNGGNCAQDVDGNPNNIDKIPQFCNNAGTAAASAMTPAELATCMECVYGFDINYLCSRDNFSVRPESFRMSVHDQNQSNGSPATMRLLKNNNDASGAETRIAAGYKYFFEVNATNHQNDNATPGYNAQFSTGGGDSTRQFAYRWVSGTYDGFCADTSDHNMSLRFIGGLPTESNITSDQVGKYRLSIYDKLWTSVDWNPDYMEHHQTANDGDDVSGYFIQGTDCVDGTSVVPVQGTPTAVNGSNLSGVSGCEISTNPSTNPYYHTNSNTGARYTDIPLRVFPYQFNVSSMSLNTQLNEGNDWVYMNDLNRSKSMAVTLEGNITAEGANGIPLSNYISGCMAQDITLATDYTSLPASIVDVNGDTADFNQTIKGADGNFSSIVRADSNITFASTNFAPGDSNGSASTNIYFNIKKGYVTPINVTDINFTRFNAYGINDISNADLVPDHRPDGNKSLGESKLFFYSRVEPGPKSIDGLQIFTPETTATAVLLAQAYCVSDSTISLNCGLISQFSGLEEVLPAGDGWYRMGAHNSANLDGQVVTLHEKDLLPGLTISPNSNIAMDTNGSSDSISISYPVSGRPVDATIIVTPDEWMKHNPDSTKDGLPEFILHFIESGLRWKGVGHTGNVMETEPSSAPSKRIGW